MEWFSREWASGYLTDAQHEDVLLQYARHTTSLRRRTPSISDLLDLNLHDGEVQEWAFTKRGFWWKVLCGDLQQGYEFVTVSYQDAKVIGGASELDKLRLDAPEVELLYDAVDSSADGPFLHRVLVWPQGEICVRFSSVTVARIAAKPDNRRGGSARPSRS